MVILTQLCRGFGIKKFLITPSDDLLHRRGKQFTHGPVGKKIATLRVFEVNVGIHIFQNERQLLFAFLQLVFCLSLLGHVGQDPAQGGCTLVVSCQ